MMGSTPTDGSSVTLSFMLSATKNSYVVSLGVKGGDAAEGPVTLLGPVAPMEIVKRLDSAAELA